MILSPMLSRFSCAMLNSWEEPGNEAMYIQLGTDIHMCVLLYFHHGERILNYVTEPHLCVYVASQVFCLHEIMIGAQLPS